ncbi:MAG: hypothetical protein E7404_07785 [Ruminococcaceae bacterium]|nr:hypothetical protein [Oscillospiraceae bacterium]
MKKLSFLLALVLIFSSIAVVPVFAASSYIYDGEYVSSYSYESYTGKDSDGSQKTWTTGLTDEYKIGNAPQKNSDDYVYHVYGTVTEKNHEIWRHSFNKSLSNDNDFKNKTDNNSYSFDIYFPTLTENNARSEFVVAAGTNKIAPYVVFVCGEFDTNRKFNIAATSTSSSIIVIDGLENDKWYNITFDVKYDGKNNVDASGSRLERNIYINGNLVSKYYKYASSKWTEANAMPIVNESATTYTDWYMLARNSLFFDVGDYHNFYFDNVIYKNSLFTPDAPATIATAENGVVKVKTDVTLNGIKALATNANAVEIYRENAESTTGYDAITENFATGDIVKLVTANGSYSYYTLNVEEDEEPPVVEPDEPENPFVIGDLTSDLDVSDGSVSATLELSGDTADKDVTLVVCLYKGITLVEMLTDTISNGDEVKNLSKSITVPTEAGNYTAKAFVWDSLNSMNMLK